MLFIGTRWRRGVLMIKTAVQIPLYKWGTRWNRSLFRSALPLKIEFLTHTLLLLSYCYSNIYNNAFRDAVLQMNSILGNSSRTTVSLRESSLQILTFSLSSLEPPFLLEWISFEIWCGGVEYSLSCYTPENSFEMWCGQGVADISHPVSFIMNSFEIRCHPTV